MFDFIEPRRALFKPAHRNSDDILPRTEWFACSPKITVKLNIPVSNVMLSYYTGRFDCYYEVRCKRVIRDLQRRHFKNGLSDIEYHFLVGGNGQVYEGRGWYTYAPPPLKYIALTTHCFSIAYVGDYSMDQPNERMIASTYRLIDLAIKKNILTRNFDIATYRNDF